MKLQHLAIICVLIIVPMSVIMAAYIQNQIDAINMQTKLDSNLINATYDAVKAFQLNTTNNKYSSISDSKIRDIEASINTFFNSLNASMSDYSSVSSDLEGYIPAILFTLYDGYYIYSSYDNVYSTDADGLVNINLDGNNYQNGLRPYVYYSAKYRLPIAGNPNNTIVINYTLDNAITVYGDVGDGNGYATKSGYLINPNDVQIINESSKILTYKGVRIEPEVLEEHLLTINNDQTGTVSNGDYRYIFYQNQKIYQDKDTNGYWLYYNTDGTTTTNSNVTGIPVLFRYDNYMKAYVNDLNILTYARDCTFNGEMKSTSAYDYYSEAQEFSRWVIEYLGEIDQEDMLMVEDGITPIGDGYLSENTGTEKIFNASSTNDPMIEASTFNNHRLAVIRKSIETNLNTVISNYRTTTLYDYAMPVVSETDWYKILNNISMVTFMQGMSIGFRSYNNYTVITNNINKEVVKAENIYIIAEEVGTDNWEYHQPGCKELLDGIENGSLEIVGAYSTASFQRQSVRVTEDGSNDLNFYLQARDGKTLTGCYNCIVNATPEYDVYDIIQGNNLINYYDKTENGGDGTISFENSNSAYATVRKIYLTALARERNDLYKSNFDLSD